MSENTSDARNGRPEIEPRLPDNPQERLAELRRRSEERGLTELEKMIVADDLETLFAGIDSLFRLLRDRFVELGTELEAVFSERADSVADSEQYVYRDEDGNVLSSAGRNGEVYPCPNCGRYRTVRVLPGARYRYRCRECGCNYRKPDSEDTYND